MFGLLVGITHSLYEGQFYVVSHIFFPQKKLSLRAQTAVYLVYTVEVRARAMQNVRIGSVLTAVLVMHSNTG